MKQISLGKYVGISIGTESLVLGVTIDRNLRNLKESFQYGCYIEIGLLFLKLCIGFVYPEKYQRYLKRK